MEPLKSTSSVHDITSDKPPFGSRFLTPDKDVWSKNAWDHVPPPDDQTDQIQASLARQRANPVLDEDKAKYNEKPARHWDNFYKMNNANFFRNRKWLHTEFPELIRATQPDAGHVRVAEIGCGTGSSVFPLLTANQNPHLKIHAYDYSNHAIKLVQNNPLYLSPPCGSIQASVWDLASRSPSNSGCIPPDLEPHTVDIVILIFVLSALHPDEWNVAVRNIHKMLTPNGLVVLRDYGRHDLTQLRFKDQRLLSDNFYVRGDKTRVYFFDLDDLSRIFTGSSLPPNTEISNLNGQLLDSEDPSPSTSAADTFSSEYALTTPSLPLHLTPTSLASTSTSLTSPTPTDPITQSRTRTEFQATPPGGDVEAKFGEGVGVGVGSGLYLISRTGETARLGSLGKTPSDLLPGLDSKVEPELDVPKQLSEANQFADIKAKAELALEAETRVVDVEKNIRERVGDFAGDEAVDEDGDLDGQREQQKQRRAFLVVTGGRGGANVEKQVSGDVDVDVVAECRQHFDDDDVYAEVALEEDIEDLESSKYGGKVKDDVEEDNDGGRELVSLTGPKAISSAFPTPPLATHSTPTHGNSNPQLYPHHHFTSDSGHLPRNALFTILQLGIDRRLLVNRKRKLKMYRVWMQGKFQVRDSSNQGKFQVRDSSNHVYS